MTGQTAIGFPPSAMAGRLYRWGEAGASASGVRSPRDGMRPRTCRPGSCENGRAGFSLCGEHRPGAQTGLAYGGIRGSAVEARLPS